MARRFAGEATIDTLFGLIDYGRRKGISGKVAVDGPIKNDEIFAEAAKLLNDDQYFPAPPGFLPYGAVFRCAARAVGGDGNFDFESIWRESDIKRLGRSTANHICRMLMAGEMSAAVAPDAFMNPVGTEGYYTLPKSHWHSDSAVDRCEEGLLFGQRQPITRFVIIDSEFQQLGVEVPQVEKGRPATAYTAASFYWRVYPQSHLQSQDRKLRWPDLADKVAAAGGPRVKGETLGKEVRKDPRWPR